MPIPKNSGIPENYLKNELFIKIPQMSRISWVMLAAGTDILETGYFDILPLWVQTFKPSYWKRR